MGKVLINGIPYGGSGGGSTDYIELTQAEYDELTTEEKMNGTLYFIIDGQNDGGDAYFYPMLYSEEEREVGTWIDGKPLYQKTYNYKTVGTTNPSIIDSDVKSNSGIIEVKKIVGLWSVGGFGYQDATIQHIGNSGTFTAGDQSVNVRTTPNGLAIYRSNTNLGVEVYLTIRYTKTTDAAGSGKYNTLGVPNHHYSTDEKIVGTWIDGSTVYEKTWQGTIPNWDSSKYGCIIGTGFTDYDEIIDIRGSIKGTVKAYGTLNGLEENGWRGNVHITTAGEVMLYANNSGDIASLVGGKAIITIQYTKTQGGA